jgi:hypothetical protein
MRKRMMSKRARERGFHNGFIWSRLAWWLRMPGRFTDRAMLSREIGELRASDYWFFRDIYKLSSSIVRVRRTKKG